MLNIAAPTKVQAHRLLPRALSHPRSLTDRADLSRSSFSVRCTVVSLSSAALSGAVAA
jgi:hypothetical protein